MAVEGSNLLVRRGEGFPEADPFRLYIEILPELRTFARAAAEDAYSYREDPVLVGSAALSIVEGTEIWAITYGYNTKSEGQEKNCAELKNLQAAEDEGMTRMIGMVNVSGNTKEQNRSITNIPSLNLPPCDVCHGDFKAHPVARDDMIITTGGVHHDTVQVNTAERFRRWQSEEPELIVYERLVRGLDGQKLVAAYDRILGEQRYVSSRKKLTPSEIVILAVLSQDEIIQ